MISSAAAICAASYASAISGCSAAASDQVFGPLTVTSTNRTPLSSFRSRPFARAGLDVVAGDPPLVGLAVHVGSALDGTPGLRDDPHGDAAALGEVVVVSPGAVGLDVVPGGGRCAAVDLHARRAPEPPPSTTVDNHETAGQGVHRRPSRY